MKQLLKAWFLVHLFAVLAGVAFARPSEDAAAKSGGSSRREEASAIVHNGSTVTVAYEVEAKGTPVAFSEVPRYLLAKHLVAKKEDASKETIALFLRVIPLNAESKFKFEPRDKQGQYVITETFSGGGNSATTVATLSVHAPGHKIKLLKVNFPEEQIDKKLPPPMYYAVVIEGKPPK